MKNVFRTNHLLRILESYDPKIGALDSYLRSYFRLHKSLGSKDRKYVAETIYGLVRWQGRLDYHCPKPISWADRLMAFEEKAHEIESYDLPPMFRSASQLPSFLFWKTTMDAKEQWSFAWLQMSPHLLH